MSPSSHWDVDTDLPPESPKGLAKAKKTPKTVPLVIDFGSWQCRAGFANEDMPSLVFDQVVHRVSGKDGSVCFAVGRSVPAGVSKTSSRTAFDSGLLVHFTTVERTLDCIFDHLKQGDSSIHHPVVISEPLGNPPYIRDELAELLLDGYGVPRVAFVDDIVPSLMHNRDAAQNCLVLSLGHSFSCVGLYLGGRLAEARRLLYGGSQAAELLLKLMQCKYPSFPVKLSLSQATCIVWKACAVAADYDAVLKELESPEGISKHDFVVQFPYPVVDKALEARREQQAATLLEKRREMAERLRQRAEAKRVEKLRAKEDRCKALTDLLASIRSPARQHRLSLDTEDDLSDTDTDVDEEHFEQLRVHGFESMAELEDAVGEAERDLGQFKNKLLGVVEEKEEPKYHLIAVPDEQLSEEQIREKRKQRLLKASADAREKIRLEKEKQAKAEEERARQDDQWRDSDFAAWRSHYYSERAKLVSTIKSRQKQREALADRRSQASTARLKSVMSLVDADESDHEQQQQQQQGSQGKKKRPKRKHPADLDHPHEAADDDDDGFGADDADWQIYRQIRRDDLSDDEEDERDQERLAAVEQKLEEHDPDFYGLLAEEMSQKATIVDLLRNGGKTKVAEDESDDAAAYQLHINVERYRVPEVLFQPHIAGIEQAGLVEVVQDLLKDLDESTASSLLQNIFLCGGWSQLPGLQDRLLADLTALFPVGTTIAITKQASTVDCWKGMAQNYESFDWITK